MTTQIQIRRDTVANWTTFDPILAEGEPGLELESGRVKYGDGTSTWSQLPYATGSSVDMGNITFSGDDIGSTNNIVNVVGSNYAQLQSNGTYIWVEDGSAYIQVNETTWGFGNDGNVSLPSTTSAINYSNGTSILDGLATTGYVDDSINSIVIPSTDWANIPNKPAFFDGDYNSLTNKPTIPSIAGLASTTYVDDAIGNISIPSTDWADIPNKPTFSPVAISGDYNDLANVPVIPNLSGYATETYVDTNIGSAISNLINGAPTAVDTLKEIADELGNNQSVTSSIVNQLANKANITDIPDVSFFATTTYVDEQTTWANISGKPTIPTQVSQLNNDSGFITIADVPAIPSNLGDFNNDVGFITSSDLPDLSGYVTGTPWTSAGYLTSSDLSGYALTSSVPTDINQLTDADNLIGQGGNPFNQNLNTTNEPTFATVTTYAIKYNSGARIYDDNSDRSNHTNLVVKADSNVIIQTDLAANYWTFGYDGYLTFPDGTVQSTAYPGAPDLSGYVTGTPWTNEGYVTGTPWTNEGYLTSSDLSGYALSSSIPTDIANLTDTNNLLGQGGGGNPFDQDLNTSNNVTFNNVTINGKVIAQQAPGVVGGYSFGGNEGGNDSGMFSETDGVVDFYSNENKILTISPSSIEVTRNITSNGLEIFTNSGSGGSIDIYTDWTGLGTTGGLDLWLLHNDGIYLKTDDGNHVWKFDNTGKLQLPAGGDIVDSTGTSVLGGGASTGNITISDTNLMSTNGDVTITFDQVASPAVQFTFSSFGEFSAAQVTTGNVTTQQVNMGYSRQVSSETSITCQPNMDTVIYTGSSDTQTTFKLLLKIEGAEIQGDFWEAQSCEMMVAKSVNNNKVAGSVYGLVYTSNGPLATFSTRWNSSINRVEVLCRPNSTTDLVSVRSFVTEMDTSAV